MTDGFAVSPTDIAGQAGPLRAASRDLQVALDRLQSSLAQLGNVSGSDDPGKKFAARYDPNTTTITANATTLTAGVLAFHESVQACADNYVGMEADNVANLTPS